MSARGKGIVIGIVLGVAVSHLYMKSQAPVTKTNS